MSEPSKPVGVTLLAILNMVVGIFSIIAGISIDFILSGGELTLGGTFQLFALFVGIFHVIAGIGLWDLRSWAWYLAAFVTIIGLINNFIIIFFDWSLLLQYLLAMLIRIVILLYLFKDSVKSKFR